jgi:hypothetical protein
VLQGVTSLEHIGQWFDADSSAIEIQFPITEERDLRYSSHKVA